MRTKNIRSTSRRRFLRASGAGIIGTSALGALSSLWHSNALAMPGPQFKAAVCVFLHGGNDSYNMVVPRSDAEHDVYATARQSLSVPKDALLPMTSPAGATADYGFHPSMPGVRDLFEAGDLSVVANVGALVQPTTKVDYQTNALPLPPKLFSHSSQRAFWQSAEAFQAQTVGWGGRIADLLSSQQPASLLPMSISYNGYNLLQAGGNTASYNLSFRGPPVISGRLQPARALALDALHAGSPHVLGDAFSAVMRRSGELSTVVRSALEATPAPVTSFSSSTFSQTMRSVAHMISASETLNMNRQIIFVRLEGWDTHDNQLINHPALLGTLSTGLSEFHAELKLVGLADQVLTYTMSDFGRTLTSNGDGSDHGWGGHQLVMGGGIQGQSIVGTMPDLTLDGPDDSGRGRIIPTQSVDQYGATIAKWLGVPDAELDTIFPNLSNFSSRELGLF